MKISEILRPIPLKKQDDAIWILSAILGKSKNWIFLEPGYSLNKSDEKKFKGAWKRRLKGEPLQYVVSSAPFYGREFFVDPRVLIPRPETESLVELVLNLANDMQAPKILDIGVGSGAIALTLKSENNSFQLFGTDISGGALSVAKKNAKKLGVSVEFARADLIPMRWKKRKWDIIVSNPPYLSFKKDKIATDVKKWEPRIALEPQKMSKSLKEQAGWTAQSILEASSLILPKFTVLELSPRVAALLEKKWSGDTRIERIWRESDLAGRKRFLLVAWKNG